MTNIIHVPGGYHRTRRMTAKSCRARSAPDNGTQSYYVAMYSPILKAPQQSMFVANRTRRLTRYNTVAWYTYKNKNGQDRQKP